MCVRTVHAEGAEVTITPQQSATQQQSNTSRYTKAKERYMRIHDEMIEREKLDFAKTKVLLPIAADSSGKWTACAKIAANYYDGIRDSKFFRILFHTTQPAHVITIAAVLCVTSALVSTADKSNVAGYPHSRATSFVYLASFVMHFGAQVWMTFVSGLSLYFALPRHTFGEVQRVLFPRYFTLNACLSLVTLLIFVKHHPAHTWDAEIAIQVGGMSGAFFLELLIRLYLTPPLLQLIVQKNSIERAAGVGNEIGRHNPGSLKHCPHYLKIHNAFRRVHLSIAAGNMITMACTVLHLHYIASKLCAL